MASAFLIVIVAALAVIVLIATIYCIKRTKDKKNRKTEKRVRSTLQNDDVEMGTRSDSVLASRVSIQEPNIPNQNEETQSVEVFIDDILKQKPFRFFSQQLQLFTQNYFAELGSGGFGKVYGGKLSDGTKVAVKILNSNIVDRVKEQFMAEVGTIGRTYHRNLVRLYGFCYDPNTKALVYQYMEKGSLDTVLYEKKHKVEWAKLWEIAVGVAKGLKYLHDDSPERIIHYDVKPSNVLLDSELCPKLADFGLAKLCKRDITHDTLSCPRGTIGFIAPEVIEVSSGTCKSDVYSFGMTLFEIVGRRRNFDEKLSDSQQRLPRYLWDKYDKGELEKALADGGIEKKDMVKAKTMTKLAFWCVQRKADDRPPMSVVVKILEGDVKMTKPPNPFR